MGLGGWIAISAGFFVAFVLLALFRLGSTVPRPGDLEAVRARFLCG